MITALRGLRYVATSAEFMGPVFVLPDDIARCRQVEAAQAVGLLERARWGWIPTVAGWQVWTMWRNRVRARRGGG